MYLIVENNKIVGFTVDKEAKNTVPAPKGFTLEQLPMYYIEKGVVKKKTEEEYQKELLFNETKIMINENWMNLRFKTDIPDSLLSLSKKVDIIIGYLHKQVIGEELTTEEKATLAKFAGDQNLVKSIYGLDSSLRDIKKSQEASEKLIKEYYVKKQEILSRAINGGIPESELTDAKLFDQ